MSESEEAIEFEEAVSKVQAMFPSVPKETIENGLVENNYNINGCIDELMERNNLVEDLDDPLRRQLSNGGYFQGEKFPEDAPDGIGAEEGGGDGLEQGSKRAKFPEIEEELPVEYGFSESQAEEARESFFGSSCKEMDLKRAEILKKHREEPHTHVSVFLEDPSKDLDFRRREVDFLIKSVFSVKNSGTILFEQDRNFKEILRKQNKERADREMALKIQRRLQEEDEDEAIIEEEPQARERKLARGVTHKLG